MRAPGLVVVVVVSASSPLAWLVGCSGSDTSTFQDTADAAPDPGPDPGTAFGSETPDASAPSGAACAPASVTGFTPSFAPPEALAEAACSSTQLAGYYDACLANPNDAAGCAAFKKANTACGACLESADSDAKTAPVVWHAQRSYFTLSVAACIAAETKDWSSTSCGAAYEGALECRRYACQACLSGASPSFQSFSTCQQQASSGACSDYIKTEQTTCAAVHNGGAGHDCLPPSGSTTKSVYDLLSAKFCGKG